jgi:hypothetical protein
MVTFLIESNINIVRDDVSPAGKVTRISLRGLPQGLEKFVTTYFTADETPVVYNLLYH